MSRNSRGSRLADLVSGPITHDDSVSVGKLDGSAPTVDCLSAQISGKAYPATSGEINIL